MTQSYRCNGKYWWGTIRRVGHVAFVGKWRISNLIISGNDAKCAFLDNTTTPKDINYETTPAPFWEWALILWECVLWNWNNFFCQHVFSLAASSLSIFPSTTDPSHWWFRTQCVIFSVNSQIFSHFFLLLLFDIFTLSFHTNSIVFTLRNNI